MTGNNGCVSSSGGVVCAEMARALEAECFIAQDGGLNDIPDRAAAQRPPGSLLGPCTILRGSNERIGHQCKDC